MISVIIPAHQEADCIGECLRRLLLSEAPASAAESAATVQVIVVANGCTDATAEEARALSADFAARGWRLDVLELAEGSKIAALNAGDSAAINDLRAYIDADVHVSPGLLFALAAALSRPEPAYAAGRPRIRRAQSRVSERYARFWERLPFMAEGVPGCGVYAVNGPGRARWGRFPDVTADDIFVRYHFSPAEMHGVADEYSWPVAEGFPRLVRTRRRQDVGLAEIRRLLPEGAVRTGETAPRGAALWRLFLHDPVGFAIYAAVAVTVRTPLFPNRSRWERGR